LILRRNECGQYFAVFFFKKKKKKDSLTSLPAAFRSHYGVLGLIATANLQNGEKKKRLELADYEMIIQMPTSSLSYKKKKRKKRMYSGFSNQNFFQKLKILSENNFKFPHMLPSVVEGSSCSLEFCFLVKRKKNLKRRVKSG
jgi:hypothetical protein